jgi:tRNA (adenine37-N6)-methyltransferase
VPYVDAVPGAGHGWLDETTEGAAVLGEPATALSDPTASFEVKPSELAAAQLAFLREQGVDLWPRVAAVLEAGPIPHPYRRIKRDGDAFVLAVKEWRARFAVAGRVVTVEAVQSGYRPSQIFGGDPDLEVHRAYVERFGTDASERR